MTITKSIGASGYDYSTIQSWFDDTNAVPTTLTEPCIGEVRDATFVGTAALVFAGKTASATNTITLTTANGAGFNENANKATNALRYNTSNGAVGSSITVLSGTCVMSHQDYMTISNLQFKATNSLSGGVVLHAVGARVDKCIITTTSRSSSLYVAFADAGGIFSNCLIVSTPASTLSPAFITRQRGTGAYYNCTVAIPSDKTAIGTAVMSVESGGTAVIHNCAVFGNAAADIASTGTVTVTTGYTDDATPTSGMTTGTYANQFENTAAATADWRVKAGANIVNTGTDSSTYAANDIIGTARGAGTYDVGCWEYVAQPSRKRFGGVSFASINQGVW